jgi:hypothetical protein
MTSLTDKPIEVQPSPKHWADRLLVPEMWGTLAISVMWLAVLFDSIYGANIVSLSSGSDSTSIPSSVVVAFFAFLATAVVAKRAFGRKTDSDRS